MGFQNFIFIVKKKHFVCDCYRYLIVMIFHKTSDYISSFQGHFQYAVSDLLNYNRYTPFELIQFFFFFLPGLFSAESLELWHAW